MNFKRNGILATNEGVGKKIVEALKKQSNQDVEPIQDFNEINQDGTEENFDFASTDFTALEPSGVAELYDEPVLSQPVEDITEESFEIKEKPVYEERVNSKNMPNEERVYEPNMSSMPQQPQGWNFNQIQNQGMDNTFGQPQMNTETNPAKQFDMPPNVAVLKRLITQLPSGVTKQTGAQIIKQTMEALGISMNTVLHEAQKVQDDMNESIKNCMLSIQEYKNNIRNLEKQGMDYQRQVNQLNDLISLFILSDKD